MSLRSQAAAGIRWTSLSNVLSGITDTVRMIVLARFLSPLDFGLMAMVLIVVGFVQMYSDLGISAAIIHRQDCTKEQLSSLYWLNILLGLSMFGLVWVSIPVVVTFFKEPRVIPLLRVMAVTFIVVAIGSQFEILLQKELQFKALARWEITASLSSVGVAVICAIAGFGVWALVYSYLTGRIVKMVFLARVGFARFLPSFHFARSDLKGYVSFGLFQMGERSINYLAERLDQVLIATFLGASTLGLYNFAFNLTHQPIGRINPILTRVAFPLFSKVQHDMERLRRGYIKLVSLLVTINAPLLVGLAAIAPHAVPTIFGSKWAASIILIQILSFVSLIKCTVNPIGSLQLAKGRADLGFWWNAGMFILSLPVIYAGARIGQATGIAVALLLLALSLYIPAYFLLVRPLIGKCAHYYFRAALKPVSFALLMGMIVRLLPDLGIGLPRAIELIAQIAFGASIYLLLLMWSEKKILYDFRSMIFSPSVESNSE